MKLITLSLAVACLLSPLSAQWLETTIHLPDSSGPVALCYNSTNRKVYCANRDANNVAVVDAASNVLRAFVPVGDHPWELFYCSANNSVYCTNTENASISVIDGARDSVTATILPGATPIRLCYCPVGHKLYCTLPWEGKVAVIDASTNQVKTTIDVGGYPYDICYIPGNNDLLVANCRNNTIGVVDCATETMVDSVLVGGGVNALCHASERERVYYVVDDRLYGISTDSYAILDTVAIPWGDCRTLVYCATSSKVYLGDFARYDVRVVDVDADSFVRSVTVGSSPMSLLYNPLNRKVYCACEGYHQAESTVAVIDVCNDSVVATLRVGEEPAALVWNPVENRVYVANYSSSSISVLRDSGGGIEEGPSTEVRMPCFPTVVSGSLLLPSALLSARCCLLTPDGRKVMELLPGANNVRGLSPGVYFIHSIFGIRHSDLPSKVIIAR